MARKHEEDEKIPAIEPAVVEGMSGNRVVPAEGNSKRRKLEAVNRCIGGQISLSSTQLSSRGIITGDSVSEGETTIGFRSDFSSRSPNEIGISSSSCCSTNRSSEENCSGENETSTSSCCRGRSQTIAFDNLLKSEELMDSTAKSADGVNSNSTQSPIVETTVERCHSQRSPSTPERKERIPTDAELEEFFSVTEKQIREKFANKYNFDFDKEKPLEGNYDWIKSDDSDP